MKALFFFSIDWPFHLFMKRNAYFVHKSSTSNFLYKIQRRLCQMDDCHFFFVLIVKRSEEHWLSKASAEHVVDISEQKKFKWRENDSHFVATLCPFFNHLHNVLHINVCMAYSCETIIVHWTNFTIVNKTTNHHYYDQLKYINIPSFFSFFPSLSLCLSLFLLLISFHLKSFFKEYFRFTLFTYLTRHASCCLCTYLVSMMMK
jgi:hypothetical protein